MIELAFAREIAAPAPPNSRHFDAPRWWPEWIAQILAEDRPVGPVASAPADTPSPPGTPFAAAAATLRDALRDVQDAASSAEPWAAAAASHRVYLARRTLRSLLDAALGTGPGTRLDWCACGEHPSAL